MRGGSRSRNETTENAKFVVGMGKKTTVTKRPAGEPTPIGVGTETPIGGIDVETMPGLATASDGEVGPPQWMQRRASS